MFIDFINQTIYGDNGNYFSHFNIDKEIKYYNKDVAFVLYIDINEYHNKLGYNVNTIQEEYPIIDEIIEYITDYYNTVDNHNEDIRLASDTYGQYYYDKIKGSWTVYFFKENATTWRKWLKWQIT